MRIRTIKLVALIALAALATTLALTTTSGAKNGKRGKAHHNLLTAKLNGANEVPGPGDPDGRGTAVVKLLPRFDAVCWKLEWRNIGDPTDAHIHRGGKGVAGPVVIPLFVDSQNVRRQGCTEGVTDELSREIRNNPRGFYVNIHNADFPAGAIRGQLKHTGRHRGHGHGKRR